MSLDKIKQLVWNSDRKKVIFMVVLLLILNTLLYIGTLSHNFLKDDFRLIVENPRVKDLGTFLESFGGKFFAFPDFPYLHYWRPMSLFSFYLDYQLWGLNPSGFHLFNIIINALNAILVFLIFYVVTEKIQYSLFPALFFSIHPSHVEAVSWVSGRTDLLSAFFLFTAILFFILFLKKQKGMYYTLTALFFLMALLSKENGVLFPLLAVLLCITIPIFNRPGEKAAKKTLFIKTVIVTLPFWIIDVIYVIIHHRFSGVGEVVSKASFSDLFVILKTIGVYTRVILLPFFPTPHFSMHYFDIQHVQFIAYFAVAIGILWFMISRREHYKYSLFSLLFFIFLLPVLDPEIVPSYPKIVIRFAYIPALFAGIFFLETLKLLKLKRSRLFFAGLLIFIAGLWMFESFTFQVYYKDSDHHYEGLVRHYPDDGSLLLPLALIKAGKGEYNDALTLVSHALAVNHIDPWLDISDMGGLFKANLLVITGSAEEGKQLAQSIMATTHKNEMKYFGFLILAKYYEKRNQFNEALYHLQNARKLGETSDLFYRMALVYGKLGQFENALQYLESAKTINPELPKYSQFKQFLQGLINRQKLQDNQPQRGIK